VCNLLGFLAVLAIFNIVGALIGKILSKLFKWTGLSWLDRLMGGAFGFVRGALIAIGFVAVLMAFTPKPLPEWMVDSQLLPYAVEGSDICASIAPSGIKNAFREALTDIRKAWDEQLKHKRKKSDLKPQDS
jgi:membrane protein required for colicin V production